MHYLFTYGTLQEEKIQLALYQRTLKGSKDSLKGYVLSNDKAYGQYPIIEASTIKTDIVLGTVYEITEQELIKTDHYEGEYYSRQKTRLQSGKMAWVYVKETSGE